MRSKRKIMITIGIDAETRDLLDQIVEEHKELSLSLSAAGDVLMRLGREKYLERKKLSKSAEYKIALEAASKLSDGEREILVEELKYHGCR